MNRYIKKMIQNENYIQKRGSFLEVSKSTNNIFMGSTKTISDNAEQKYLFIINIVGILCGPSVLGGWCGVVDAAWKRCYNANFVVEG